MKKIKALSFLLFVMFISCECLSQSITKGYEKFNWGESMDKTKGTITKYYKDFKFYKESKTDLTYTKGKIDKYELDGISFTYKNNSLTRILLMISKPKNNKIVEYFNGEIFIDLTKKYGKYSEKNVMPRYDLSYVWELKKGINVYAVCSKKNGVEISFEKEK
jgi:hypothetical protein